MRIFISYRRDDAAGHAGRLFDHLSNYFGKENVFMDVDSIPLGDDFAVRIEREIQRSDVVLPIIGRQWIAITGADGQRRLDDPNDLVRKEVATGLALNKNVIPILVDGAKMPATSQLPDNLQTLTRKNAHEISNTRFQYDADQLIKGIDPSGTQKRNPTPVAPTPAPVKIVEAPRSTQYQKPPIVAPVQQGPEIGGCLVAFLVIGVILVGGMFLLAPSALNSILNSFKGSSGNVNFGNDSSSSLVSLSNCTITIGESPYIFLYKDADFTSGQLTTVSSGPYRSDLKQTKPFTYYRITVGSHTGWVQNVPMNVTLGSGC